MYYVDSLNKTPTNAKMSSFKLMHLILKTRNPNKIIENILNFFNLKVNDFLLNEFNFIRFASSPIIPTSVQTQLSKQAQTNPVKAPAYSILLFTSNYANDESSRLGKGWRYHHKLELKDEKQHVIARQTFYEQSLDLPLFCMSNIRQDIMVEHTKRIIRLNINCRNFDSMLIFYRLLFDKYSNYSKRNFSVFILYQAKSFELQLSLKYDESIEPYKLDGVSLMHFIESSNEFNTILHLLNGLTNELIPGRLYSVFDPDGNQIYLVDHSKGPLTSDICMAKGLADLVFDELYESKSEDPSSNLSNNSTFSTSSTDFMGANSARTKVSTLSCATDTSSTNSESISLDSGRGSGRWSLFSDNQMQKRLNRKKASSIGNLNVQDKSNDNQYYDLCYGKISAARSLAQRKKNKQLQLRETFNLKNIQRHLNTSSDEFEGLLSLKPSDYLRKAKSVSFVDKVGDHFENLSNSAVNLSCFKRNQTRSSVKSSLKSISHKPYEWLSETCSVVRKDSAPYAQQENIDLNYLSKNFCANKNSAKSSIQISKNENLFRKCSPGILCA
jgi:hypothetical protein